LARLADIAGGIGSGDRVAVGAAIGTYTVSITSADAAYGLLLNDSGATVSDNVGGSLTLAGTGGSGNPNGMLTINAGTFALAGGMLNAGTISIASGGALLVSPGYAGLPNAIVDNGSLTVSGSSSFAGSISGAGIVQVQNGATATFNGAVTGSETFTIANTSTAIFNTGVSGSGSLLLWGSGSVELSGADSENVTFASGANGTLKLDHSLTAPFSGSLSGLNTINKVDLADLGWKSGKMTASFSGTAAGGTLTVSNGKNNVALKLLGDYTSSSWTLAKDSSGGTLVTDPPVTGSLTANVDGAAACIDLSDIAFGAGTTLAYSPNGDNSGGILTVSDGLHAQSLALLGQYMTSSFVKASDGHGGTLILDPPAPVTIANGAAFEIGSASSDAVTFAGGTGTLRLDQSQSFTGTVAGFGSHDQINLGDIAYSDVTRTLDYWMSTDSSGGTLTVSDGAHTASLTLLGQYAASSFGMASDGHGGTLITDPPPSQQVLLAHPHA
jgi:hypothetical protein